MPNSSTRSGTSARARILRGGRRSRGSNARLGVRALARSSADVPPAPAAMPTIARRRAASSPGLGAFASRSPRPCLASLERVAELPNARDRVGANHPASWRDFESAPGPFTALVGAIVSWRDPQRAVERGDDLAGRCRPDRRRHPDTSSARRPTELRRHHLPREAALFQRAMRRTTPFDVDADAKRRSSIRRRLELQSGERLGWWAAAGVSGE